MYNRSLKNFTPRERVEIALRGQRADKVPFTMYETQIPQCTAERELRNRGMCIVKRDVPAYLTHRPNVRTTQQVYWENGRKLVRTIHETPVGTLSCIDEPAGFTTWTHEQLFKSPDDYKPLLFFIRDEQYEPNYPAFAAAQQAFGDDAIFRAGLFLEPLQMLISGGMIDMQEFCIQWMEYRDEVLTLYNALVDQRRRLYPIVARSPATICNYGGNVTPEIIGLEAFEKYYVPHYNEAAEVMHKHGKLLGCHFDANCRLLSCAIASTDLDYIEAFTPAPDTDMTLAEARAAWPGKVLWVNFPSSVHLKSDDEVRATTIDLVKQAGTPDGLLMAVTEDIPEFRWQDSCRAIMDGLDIAMHDDQQSR
jgi:hypothetical protein